MPVYRVGFESVAASNGAAYATFNSATRKAKVHEINITAKAATLSQVGFGIPANEATPPVASTTIVPVGAPSDIAATARVGTAWSTAPTTPSVLEYQTILAAVIGAGWVWKWAPDEYLEVKIAGWRALWNSGAAAGSILITNILYDE